MTADSGATRAADPYAPMPVDMPAPAYWFLVGTRRLAPLWRQLGRLEALSLGRRYREAIIDRPIYVYGIARSGTTITLEILSRHPDAAIQQYRDMVFPFLPYWWRRFGPKNAGLVGDTPQERPHGDGIIVTSESVETVEEPLWQSVLGERLHDETRSNLMTAADSQPRFEAVYRDYLRKLIACQPGHRFTTKNNYYVARAAYLKRLFPDARLFLVVRDPVTHIGSLMRMDRKLAHVNDANIRVMRGLGHWEFGPGKRFVNCGDDAAIREVRRLLAADRVPQAWAHYWASVYGFLHRQLSEDAALARDTLVVRHEDLCARPGEQVDRLLAHAQHDPAPFGEWRDHYVRTLRTPDYYEPPFSAADREDIRAITRDAAAAFGY